jgi:DNA helicase II / ATP-dependent DNA helicase PcrA
MGVDYMGELNQAQYEAVISAEGPALIIAGAGSGKTRVLTYRIAHLLQRGIRPYTILALTFTNKAAREMKERIASVVGEDTARYLWMGTFHSIFSRILRIEHETTGFPSNFTIFDAGDSKSLIKTIIKSFQLDDKTYKPGVVAARISLAKNNLITPSDYARNDEAIQTDRSIKMPAILEIYKEYTKRCRLSGAMDFDDLLLKTFLLFRDHSGILEKYRQQFLYVLVDEYQDTNYAQYRIIKMLVPPDEEPRNICVVGDDAQSIYSFRGARIENILSFRSDYPGFKIFKLEQNYRSTQTIVNAANSIIAKNKRQIPKKVFSENPSGKTIGVIAALTDNEEGFLVAQEIVETQLRDHYKNQDYAILYRTNAQSRIFEEALRKKNIPYKIYGGISFYQRKEIRDLLAYFRLIINPRDNEALKRIINYPARGIGQTTVAKLETAAANAETSIRDIIDGLPEQNPAELNKGIITKVKKFMATLQNLAHSIAGTDACTAAEAIATQTGMMDELYNDKSPEGISRRENIQELINAIKVFSENAREEGRPGELENFMEEVALITDQDTEKKEDRDKVTLMTIHSAKGLEFKNVFVAGLEEKLFPSPQAEEKKTPDAIEEERRLFYVALTRAKENAWFSYARQRYRWGTLEPCTPSRFLLEMDEKYLNEMNGNRKESLPSGQPLINPRNRMTGPGRHPSSSLRKQHAGQRPWLQEVIRKKNEEQSTDNRESTSPDKIIQGMMVEHQRFGTGKVLKVEGPATDRKATVFFQNMGQKQLLLKFAKLRVIG